MASLIHVLPSVPLHSFCLFKVLLPYLEDSVWPLEPSRTKGLLDMVEFTMYGRCI